MSVESKDYSVFCICVPKDQIDGETVYEIDSQYGFANNPQEMTKLKYDLNLDGEYFKVKKVMFSDYISKFVGRFCED